MADAAVAAARSGSDNKNAIGVGGRHGNHSDDADDDDVLLRYFSRSRIQIITLYRSSDGGDSADADAAAGADDGVDEHRAAAGLVGLVGYRCRWWR